MLITIKDLKASFIAFAPRMNGIPMGRTGFQDFEIAYFLNLAYEKLLQQRVGQLMNAYSQTFAPPDDHHTDSPRRDIPYGGLISEFGTLYRSSVHLPDWKPADFPFARANLLWDEGMSHIFEVMPVNGFVPYIIGCDLFERHIDMSRQQRAGTSLSVTYPIRILNESEILKYSNLLNSNPNALPYRIARLRADTQFSYTASLESAIDYLDSFLQNITGASDPMQAVSDRMPARQQVYLLELLHNKQYSDSELTCSMQFICHPEPITREEVMGSGDRLLEVSFGYEIAEMAAGLATGLLQNQQPPAQQQHQ